MTPPPLLKPTWAALEDACVPLRRAATSAAVAPAAAVLAQAVGARFLAIAKLAVAGGGPGLAFVEGVFPDGWRERYEADRLGGADPLALALPAPGFRLRLGDALARAPADAPVRRHYEAAGLLAGEVLAFRPAQDWAPWIVLLAAPCEAVDVEAAAQRRWAAEVFRDEAVRRLAASAAAPRLTTRQRACLMAAALGRNSVQIAADLRLAPKTVDAYLAAAATRLGARDRVAAVTTALRLGLI